MTKKSVNLFITLVVMLFASALDANAQRVVKGLVVDAEGTPLPGVSVLIKGKETAGTVTTIDGKYAITAAPRDSLTFSYIGFATQKFLVGNHETIDVVMKEDATMLQETVVVAFAKQKKNSVIGSIETINPAELKTPSTNLTNTLAGRIAGVISYQRSGEPGKDNANFFVRGVTTFGYSASPLILIDGVEMTSEDLARLEPENIASFSIMKDATATALYGAKGANGVILVTTKSGKKGKTKITARLETQISTPTKILDFVDGVEYMNLYNYAQKTRNPNAPDAYTKEKIENTRLGTDPMLYPNVDWYGMMFKNQAINTKATVTASGGGEVAQYYLSAAYTHEAGLLKVPAVNNYNNNISINRYNIRANIDVNLTKTTKAGVKIYSLLDRSNTPAATVSDSQNHTGLFDQIMRANPVNFPAYYDKSIDNRYYYADHVLYGNTGGRAEYPNPYASMMVGYKDAFSYTGNSIFTLEQDLKMITEGLSARALASFTSYGYRSTQRTISPFYYGLVTNVSELGTSYNLLQIREGSERLSDPSSEINTNSSYYFEAALQYNREFGKHAIGALLVGQMKEQLGNTGGTWGTLPVRNLGLSGRLTYAFDDRYFIEGNFGYNGSEKFDGNHRWGFFPSIGLGYLISNEKFWTNAGLDKLFPSFKFKASYGFVGNDAIMAADKRFYYIADVNINNANTGYRWGQTFTNTVYPGYSINHYANENIGWEKSTKQNYGIEVDILGKANFQIEYFREDRKDIYQEMESVPQTMGNTATIYANLGKAKSWGIDASFDINWSINRNWWVQSRFNYTYATSEYIQGGDVIFPEPWRNKMGYNLSQKWGYVAERLFIDEEDVLNSPVQFGLEPIRDYMAGDIKYVDINGDGAIDTRDQVAIGFPETPEIIYGFGISTGYKGFDASFFFQGSAHSSFFIDPSSIQPFVGYRNALKIVANNYWSEENPDPHAFWPRLSTTTRSNNTVNSTWWLRDGSFLRLKTLEVGYSLPTKMTKKWGFDLIRIFASGNNLFCISDFDLWDPEMGGYGTNYPTQRVYNIGLNIEF